MSRSSHIATSDRPNFIVRAVARLRVSIRVKLLVAFLGIAALLAGLALFGLTSLQQANDRTEALVHDQQRIALFNDLYASLDEIKAIVLALSIEREFIEDKADAGWFGALGWATSDRTSQVLRDLNIASRRFGKPGMPDAEILASVIKRLKELTPAAVEIANARRDGDWARAAHIGRTIVFEGIRVIQRDAYTRVQQIESEMNKTARLSARAFVQSRQQVISAAAAAIGLALLVGYAMSSALIWPVRRIGQALGVIANGDFNARVSVPNGDELGELAGNVNATSAQLGTLYDEVEAQKTQLEGWNADLEAKVTAQVNEIERANRLRRFLPGQVADLITGSESETEALATRRGEITVLFADLRGFTGFASQAPPQQVVAALNAFHTACGPLIESRGGTLERFLGDGLMVLFGAPLPVEDPAGRAVALAQDMQAAVHDAMAPFRTGDKPLGLGIGIGSGAATLGQIGFEGRMDYSAIGPAPNLAARLCDKASDGQILISHATAWQIDVDMEPAGPFDLKGIGPEVAAFEIS